MRRTQLNTLLFLVMGLQAACQNIKSEESENRMPKASLTVKEKRETEADKMKYLVTEKTEYIEKAEKYLIKLEREKDYLIKLPVNKRDIEAFKQLNLISDKEAQLHRLINETKISALNEWQLYQNRMNMIFDDIDFLLEKKNPLKE
jgi:hypothetical protein